VLGGLFTGREHIFHGAVETGREARIETGFGENGTDMGQAVTRCAYLALGDIGTTEEYNSNYLRSLETLTKWADAYAALLVSVTLVVVVQ
jgi:hypothetical protein|tara:strand:+ start:348 stop:617 length:270 start_codon:yes stop_codon:yes gene_type:complete